MADMSEYREYAPTFLRVAIGALFLNSGITKLLDPAGVTGMLGSIGFPAPSLFAWVLLLSEILFGLAVLSGFWVRYAVWPLVLIMLVALFTVVIPSGEVTNALFHVVTIAGLVALFLLGPGRLALGDRRPA